VLLHRVRDTPVLLRLGAGSRPQLGGVADEIIAPMRGATAPPLPKAS
jgi:hypothetical protein